MATALPLRCEVTISFKIPPPRSSHPQISRLTIFPPLRLLLRRSKTLFPPLSSPASDAISAPPDPIFLCHLRIIEEDVEEDKKADEDFEEESPLYFSDGRYEDQVDLDSIRSFFKSRTLVPDTKHKGSNAWSIEDIDPLEAELLYEEDETLELDSAAPVPLIGHGFVEEILQTSKKLPENYTLGDLLSSFSGKVGERECIEILLRMGEEGLEWSCLHLFEWMGLQEPPLVTPKACSILFTSLGKAGMGEKLMIIFENLPPVKKFRDIRVYNAAISGLSCCRSMGKHREECIAATWDANEVMIFCELCLKEIELGNRPTTHFSKDGWTNLMNNFQTRTGKAYDRTQLKNKWDQLKKDWKLWKDLKRGSTGLGWDPIRKTVAAPEEWWEERLQVLPAAKKFKYMGISPELEEKMEMMFTQVVATGNLVWTPNARSLGPESVDEHVVSVDDDVHETEELQTPLATNKKRKEKGKMKKNSGKKALSSTMDEIAQTSRIIGRCMMEPPKIQISSSLYTIPDTIKELEKYVSITTDFELYDYASLFLRDKANRETFMSIPDEIKVKWLQARLRDNTQ